MITREDLRRCAVGASESEVATSWVGGWDARNDTTEAGGDQQHSWEAALLRLEDSGTPVFRESVVEEDMARQGHPGRDRQDATRDGNIPEGLHRVIPVRQAAGQQVSIHRVHEMAGQKGEGTRGVSRSHLRPAGRSFAVAQAQAVGKHASVGEGHACHPAVEDGKGREVVAQEEHLESKCITQGSRRAAD